MWYRLVFDLHPAGVITIALLHGLVACVLAFAVARCVYRRFGADSLPHAPYFVSVTTLLAIVFAFLAAEIWSLNRQAGAAARMEAESFQRIADVAHAMPVVAENTVGLLQRYAHEVEAVEWGGSGNGRASLQADAVLSQLRRDTTRQTAAGLPPVAAAELYGSIDRLSEARRIRISVGAGHGDSYSWALVIILSVFSHVAIAVVHADRTRAMVVALAIFSPALCLAIGVVAIHDNPYVGVVTVHMPDFAAMLAAIK